MLHTLWNGLCIICIHAKLKKIGLHEIVFPAFLRSLACNEWDFVDVEWIKLRWR
jgi:hypothetical protein